MAETVGTARIDLVVNTDQFDAAINSAKRSVSGMSAQAQAEYNKLSAAEKRRVDSLIKQADTLGFTRQQQILYNAVLKNVPTAVLDELKNKLNTTATAQQALANTTAGATKAFSGTAKTARELQFATRGLPAQFTDIFTSLASGQKPMLVLLQQGGQVKDMFGGLGPAVRAMGGYIAGLVNPTTLAAGGFAVLIAAWAQAEKQASAFTKALLTTGNFADMTSAQLEGMVGKLSDLQSVTAGGARDAILQVVQSGRIAADQVELVAEVAARMQSATGQGIDVTVKKFEELGKAPVETLLKLNDTEHFLTRAQLDRVEALSKEGREQEAAAEAASIYAARLDEVASAAEAARPHLSKMWQEAKDGASEAWEATKGFAEFLAASAEKFQQRPWWQRIGLSAGFAFVNDMRTAEPTAAAPSKPVTGAVDSTQERARLEFEKEGLRFATQRQKMEKDIAEARALGLKAGIGSLEIEKRVAAIRADYARKDKSGRGLEGAGAKAALQAFEDTLKQEQGAIANSTQLLQAQYAAKLVTVQDYYAQLRSLTQQGAKAQEDSILGQIGVLKARNVTGKEGIDVTRQIATLEVELARVRADAGTKLAVLGIQEAGVLRQRRQATEAYTAALDENTDAIKAQVDSMLARIGMGEREFAIQTEINARYKAMSKELLNLARQRDAGQIDAPTFAAREGQLRAATDRQVQIIRDGYDRMAVAQANWENGATAALANFRDKAADVAGATQDALSNAFEGASDVVAEFVTTGKADFGDFVNSVIKDFARMESRILLSKVFDWIAGYLGGGTSTSVANPITGEIMTNAKGGVYASNSLSAYSGGIYDRPQLFKFAHGAGVFGEAGPEAIMPLKRGPGGKLGVVASGGGGITLIVENNVGPANARTEQSTGPDGQQLIKLILDAAEDRAAASIAGMGKVGKAAAQRFNLAPAGVSRA